MISSAHDSYSLYSLATTSVLSMWAWSSTNYTTCSIVKKKWNFYSYHSLLLSSELNMVTAPFLCPPKDLTTEDSSIIISSISTFCFYFFSFHKGLVFLLTCMFYNKTTNIFLDPYGCTKDLEVGVLAGGYRLLRFQKINCRSRWYVVRLIVLVNCI